VASADCELMVLTYEDFKEKAKSKRMDYSTAQRIFNVFT